jgi:hypothetical protein
MPPSLNTSGLLAPFGKLGHLGLTGAGATTYAVALKAVKAKVREVGATDIVVLP